MKQKLSAMILTALMVSTLLGISVSASTTNLALGATVTTNSQHATHVASRAVDGSTATRWQTISSQKAPWIILDLGEAKTFNKITMIQITATYASYLTSYKFEAADDEAFETNVVTLAEGTGSETLVTIKHLFPTVTKRFVRASFVATSNLGISELELYDISLNSLEVEGDYLGVAVPNTAGETRYSNAPAATVTDEQNDTFAAPAGSVEWSLKEACAGVSIDGTTGRLAVTSEAEAGTVSVRAALASNPLQYVDKTVTITKEAGTDVNLAPSFGITAVNSASGAIAKNAADGSIDTVWQSGAGTESSFAFATGGKALNKLVAYLAGQEAVTGYRVLAADSADFSGASTLAESAQMGERTAVSFPETNKAYIKLELTHTGQITVKEVELYKMLPVSIDTRQGYGSTVIPGEGAASVTAGHNAVVMDKEGDVIDPANYTMQYVLDGYGAEGVSLDAVSGLLTIADNAADGIYYVTASLPEYSSVAEVQLPFDLGVDKINGMESANLALNKTVRATSAHSSHGKERAVDGLANTRWQSTTNDLTPTLTIDLGNTYYFNKVNLTSFCVNVAIPVKECVIEAADDFDFTQNVRELCRMTDLLSNVKTMQGFAMERARYVRFRAIEIELSEQGKNPGVGLLEFELYRVRAVGIDSMNDLGSLYIPSEGSHTFTNFAANPMDSEGCTLSGTDFPIQYELQSAPLEEASLDPATGAIIVEAGQAEASMQVKATLGSDAEQTVTYTVYLTNQYDANVSQHPDFFLTQPVLVDADGLEVSSLADAAQLSFSAVGRREGKTGTLTFIINTYTDETKTVKESVSVQVVPVTEFEENTYSLQLTGLNDKAGRVTIYLWDNFESLQPVLKALEY